MPAPSYRREDGALAKKCFLTKNHDELVISSASIAG